jgi:hypothetical protein
MRKALKDFLPKQIAERPRKTDLTEVFLLGMKNNDQKIWQGQRDSLLETIAPYINRPVAENCDATLPTAV